MQDIAGTRLVIPMLVIQDDVALIVVRLFKAKGAECEIAKDTRERGDDYGYRAVHVVPLCRHL
jgi:ppGpp synthetase/RelA/SpoT-type nucleotidyltranferase